MAKVDIIIPFFNTPIEYMRAALDSVLAQTHTDWRVAVINDGSTGPSTRDLEDLLAAYGNEKFLYWKTKNQRIAGARNTGIRKLDAPYIALLDSDDMWRPARLERMVPILDKDAGIDLVHSNVDIIDAEGTIIGRSRSKGGLNELSPEALLVRELQEDFVSCPTVLVRRSAVEAVGLFDESFPCVQDKMLWVRLLAEGSRFYYLDETVALYRRHASNLSKNVEKRMDGRNHLIRSVGKMAESNAILKKLNWEKMKKQMVRHLFQEASEGYLEQGSYWKALKYSLPVYSGCSVEAGKLTLRSGYNWLLS